MTIQSDTETRSAVRSYRTEFEHDEDPISEDGNWLNGARDGVDWTDVVVKNGVAHGAYARNSAVEARAEQGNLESGLATGDYDDPTAILLGDWGPDQYVKGRAFIRNETEDYFQEIQLRVRHELKAGWCTGYEFIFRAMDSSSSYVEIVRWNGVIGDWTSLARKEGPDVGIRNGDIVEARVVGDTLTGAINGRDVISVSDSVLTSGAPGIGFNFGVGHTNVDHGFTSFETETFGA